MASSMNNNANLQHQTAAAADYDDDFDVGGPNDLKIRLLVAHRHPNSAAATLDDEAVKVQIDAIISRQAKVAETETIKHPYHFHDDGKATITIDEVEPTAEDRIKITQYSNTDERHRRRIEEDNDGADIMEEVPQEVSVEGAENDDETVVQAEQDEMNNGKDDADAGDDGEQQEEEVDATVEDAGHEELENELEQQQQQGELDEQEQVADVEGGSEEQHAIEDLQDEGESQETTPTTEPEEGQSNIDINNNNPTTNSDWDPYHILHPKNNGDGSPPIGPSSSSSHSAIGAIVSLSLLAASSFFVCICCLRYYSRRRRHSHNHYRYNNIYSSNYNNNGSKVYSALHGSDDFFSDDVSYFEKDSDDEEYDDDDDDYDTLPMNYSHDSDDDIHKDIGTRGGVRLEMRGRNINGAMQESLTLDECNG
jgi:hypothetical protein